MRHRIARFHAPLPLCSLLAASLLLGACVNQPASAPALPPLAQDRDEPVLALIEHVLAEHFAREGAATDPPTTCVELRPDPLTSSQEEALIARFPRLAPRARCETEMPPPSDEFTGERAVLVQVYGLECSDATHCAAWVSPPGSPAVRYAMVFESDTWAFARDRRILAE
jgi:hypothetical protein